MVDISLEGSHDYWKSFPDQSVYRVIVLLESVEQSFYHGDADFEDAMEKLGDSIDLMSEHSPPDPMEILEVLAYLKTSRYLRFLQGMDGVSPGAASKVIQAAERSKPTDKAAQIFLKRNIFFERYRLLCRVLSQERLELVTSALEVG